MYDFNSLWKTVLSTSSLSNKTTTKKAVQHYEGKQHFKENTALTSYFKSISDLCNQGPADYNGGVEENIICAATHTSIIESYKHV